jgi:sterol desaturase/sphingolipid hydroxylase (fatty acid hydroxylase superfamily)
MWRTIIDLVELFVILAPLFWLLERLAGGRRGLFRAGLVTDLTYWMFTPLVTRWLTNHGVIVGVFLVAIAMGFGPRSIPQHGFGPVLRQPVILQAIEIIVLSDLIAYWIHRLFHGGRFWHFHAIHHSAGEVDWMTTQRVHPFNDVFLRVAQAVPLFVMGFTPTVLAVYHLLDIFYAFLVHADVNWTFGPLRYVLVSPVFHRWHHSKRPEAIDKNFATMLPLWDLIFRTLYLPKGVTPSDFGVHEKVPENVLGQMIYPFVPSRQLTEPSPITYPRAAECDVGPAKSWYRASGLTARHVALAPCVVNGATGSNGDTPIEGPWLQEGASRT